MDYFSDKQITDPGESLPPDTLRLLGPYINQGLIQFRKFSPPCVPSKNVMFDTLKRLACGIFKLLAPLELSRHRDDGAALQKSVGVEGGVGEVALRYVHYIHHKTGFGRLPMHWHQDISGYLAGLAEDLEADWWGEQSGHRSALEIGTPPLSATNPLLETGDPPPPSPRVNTETGLRITQFMQSVADETGMRITKKMIWTVAGYKNRTDFERFQREDT